MLIRLSTEKIAPDVPACGATDARKTKTYDEEKLKFLL